MSTVSTDPIADMLSRIRNAMAVNKNEVLMPHSKIKESVAKILQSSGFIDKVTEEEAIVGKSLKIIINSDGTNARITEIQRLSKPGRRMYVNADSIPTVKRGRGIVVVSTSRGVMSGEQAKKERIGGELICQVY
jgi:small subunit ribosomal protein S8